MKPLIPRRGNDPRWACEHKRSFDTPQAAQAQLRSSRKRLKARKRYVDPYVVYRCEYCGKWHLGHRRTYKTVPPGIDPSAA